MINGNLTEFIDKLYYGEELFFEYHNSLYFVQGWTKDGMAYMVLDEQSEKPFESYLWECKKPTMRECADCFMNESLWDDRNFLQIERDVIWKD